MAKTFAGEAFVRIGAVSDGLRKGLADAQKAMGAFSANMRAMGAGIASIGGAVFAPLAAATKAFSDYGDEAAKMARRTGLSVEAVTGLAYAAENSGATVQDVEAGIRGMSKALMGLADDGTAASDVFKRLGLSEKDLQGLSVDEQFGRIGDALTGIESPSERAALAMKVFGKAGTSLLPLFAEGPAGIKALTAEAKRLGIVLDAETAAKAEVLDDALTAAWASIRGVGISIGSELAPYVSALARGFSEAVAGISKFIRENGDMVKQALQVGAVIAGVGASLLAVSGIAAAASAAFGLVGSVVAGLASIFSPVVLAAAGLAAALVLVADAAFGTFGGISGQLATLVGSFRVGGLRIATWFSIVWASIRESWAGTEKFLGTGVDAFTGGWDTALQWLKGVFAEIANWIVQRMADVVQGIGGGINALLETAVGVGQAAGIISEDTGAAWVRSASRLQDAMKGVADDQRQKAADFYGAVPKYQSKAREDAFKATANSIGKDLSAALAGDTAGQDGADRLRAACDAATGPLKDQFGALLAQVQGAAGDAAKGLGGGQGTPEGAKTVSPEKAFGSWSAKEVAAKAPAEKLQERANGLLASINGGIQKIAAKPAGGFLT